MRNPLFSQPTKDEHDTVFRWYSILIRVSRETLLLTIFLLNKIIKLGLVELYEYR
jgi:hypothetical protein